MHIPVESVSDCTHRLRQMLSLHLRVLVMYNKNLVQDNHEFLLLQETECVLMIFRRTPSACVLDLCETEVNMLYIIPGVVTY